MTARGDEALSERGELTDDVVWHGVVAELGLGPDLERLEELERRDRAGSGGPGERGWIGRVEALLGRVPPPARGVALVGLLGAGAAGLAVGTVVATRLLVGVAGALPGLLGDRPLELYAALAHVVVVAVFLVLLGSGAAPREPFGLVPRNAWRQLRRGWTLLWCSWLALYVWLGAYWGLERGASAFWDRLGPPIADLLNIASSAVFFYLFLVLDRPSVKADGLPERDRTFRRSLAGVGIVCGAAALLSILGRFGRLGLDSLGPQLGSILVAISMAFFVGRLSDSHLRVRRALLAPLYLYVAIQMLWHLFVMHGTASETGYALVLFGALALKVYLFALVTRWMQDGELQRYFDEVAFPRLPSDLER